MYGKGEENIKGGGVYMTHLHKLYDLFPTISYLFGKTED